MSYSEGNESSGTDGSRFEFPDDVSMDATHPGPDVSVACGAWSPEEDKVFENALAELEDLTPNLEDYEMGGNSQGLLGGWGSLGRGVGGMLPDLQWKKLATKLPGRSLLELQDHYQSLVDDIAEIESGAPPAYLLPTAGRQLPHSLSLSPQPHPPYPRLESPAPLGRTPALGVTAPGGGMGLEQGVMGTDKGDGVASENASGGSGGSVGRNGGSTKKGGSQDGSSGNSNSGSGSGSGSGRGGKQEGSPVSPQAVGSGGGSPGAGGAKGSEGSKGGKGPEQERRKGIPWSEEEHRLFLLGLAKFGKGDWRSISRNFVISRTPTQVASHAQKYFIRLNSINKDKRRSSIHDITSVSGSESDPPSSGPITGQPTTSVPASTPQGAGVPQAHPHTLPPLPHSHPLPNGHSPQSGGAPRAVFVPGGPPLPPMHPHLGVPLGGHPGHIGYGPRPHLSRPVMTTTGIGIPHMGFPPSHQQAIHH